MLAFSLNDAYIMPMWKKTKPKPEPDTHVLISALTGRVAALERDYKAIETEWTEMYDKFRRLHMRLAKRAQRDESPSEPSNGGGPTEMSVGARRLLGRI